MEGTLLGREAELRVLERFLDRARSRFGCLLIEGEPGIGKTTLWREGVRRAATGGWLVLSSRPAEAEAKLSYSGLGDVVERLPEHVFAALPAVQRQALEVALLRVPAGPGGVEPRAVAAGVRSALVEAGRACPVLVAIDDLQWLDSASATGLAHALRRLEGEPIGVLLTRRSRATGRQGLELAVDEELRLDRLSVAAVHELVKERHGISLSRPVLLRLHDASGGNPFHALEIARELSVVQPGPADPLPVPEGVREVVRRRITRLSPSARQVLLVVASASTPTRELIDDVLGVDSTPALEEAEGADVVRADGKLLRFVHPLYGAAVYEAASRAHRVSVHEKLARAAREPEERARHLAIAVEAPSAAVAAELEAAAVEARGRGAAIAAGTLLLEAARLTPAGDATERRRRELGAAQGLFDGMDSEAAEAILGRLVEEMPPGADRSRALLLQGLILSYGGYHLAAKEACSRAIEDAGADPWLLAEAELHFALVCYDDSRAARQSVAAARAIVDDHPDPPHDLAAAVLLDDAYQGLYLGEGLPLEQVERAMELVPAHAHTWLAQRAQVVAHLWAKYTDDLVTAHRLLHALVEQRHEEGDDYDAMLTLRHLVEVECWLGDWQSAKEHAAELDETSTDQAVSDYARALVSAYLGDAERARAAGERGLALSGENPWYRALNLSVLGFIELSLSKSLEAARHLDEAAECVARIGMPEPVRFRFDGDHVESLVAVGRLADAEALVEELGRRAVTTPRPWNRVMHGRGRALVLAASGDADGAVAAAEQALQDHQDLPMPFEEARTWLVKGEIQRRAKRRAAAKDSLSRALAEFDGLGAQLWSRRAQEEIERIGLRRTSAGLTVNEQRVAELAAAGLTNREVAARLFLSPKTVEANLARVYRKLGIRTRAELGARFGDVGSPTRQT